MKWYDVPIVVMDFETTGFKPPRFIIEIGAIRYEQGREVDRLELLVRPGARIEKGATDTHGLSDADVATQPPFHERYPVFRDFLRGAVPASYGTYDPRVLHEELKRMRKRAILVDEQVPAFSRSWGPWLDLLGWARALHPGPRRKGHHTLATMTKRYDVELLKAHRAIDDAAAAGALLWAWRDRLPDVSLSALLAEDLPS